MKYFTAIYWKQELRAPRYAIAGLSLCFFIMGYAICAIVNGVGK